MCFSSYLKLPRRSSAEYEVQYLQPPVSTTLLYHPPPVKSIMSPGPGTCAPRHVFRLAAVLLVAWWLLFALLLS